MKSLKKKVKVWFDYYINQDEGKGIKRKYIVVDLPPKFEVEKGELVEVIVNKGK